MTAQPYDAASSAFQPRDLGGRFAAYKAPEASGISLVPDAPEPEVGSREWHDVVSARARDAVDIADDLISYATSDGYTEVERPEDVEEALREAFPHVEETTFHRHFDEVARLAEICSHMEHSIEEDPYDTDAWMPYAEEFGITEDQHPIEDPEPGGPYTDWAEMAKATNAEAGLRIYGALRSLAEDDERARRD